MKKTIAFFPLLFLFNFFVFPAENLPLMAVPDIAAVGVSENLAVTSRNMVETALIKTGKFTVLSQTDMEEILEAQAFSLSGCVDESCAIEIGELLAADNIVVGDLSQLGADMVLSIRLVNVGSGQTVRGEVATITDLSELQEKIFFAAYALAGLKYVGGSAVVETGSIYVKAPKELLLEVTLDGKSYGKTPALIEDIDFGVHLLEARSGSYFFSTELSIVSKDIMEVFADVEQLKGSLFLTVEPIDADGWRLFVDDQLYEDGLLKDVPVGDHQIEVSGGGWYYSGSVTAEADTTIRKLLKLSKAGAVYFFGPEGIEAELDLPGFETIRGERIKSAVSLPSGSYSYRLFHPDYIVHEGVVEIETGHTLEIRPEWEHNEAWFSKERIRELEQKIPGAEETRSIMMPIVWSFTGLGSAGLVLGGASEAVVQISASLLSDTYEKYHDATDTSVVKTLGDSINGYESNINTWRDVRNWSLIGTGTSLVIAGIIRLFTPSPDVIRARIVKLEEGLK